MKSFLALLKKELYHDLRSFELLITLLALSALSVIIFGLSLESGFLSLAEKRKVFPALLWLVFLFVSSIATSRSFEHERRSGAFEAVLLTGVSAWKLFLSKALVLFFWYCLSFLALYVFFSAFLGVHLSAPLADFTLISLLSLFSLACLATLLSALCELSRLRSSMLPLVQIPFFAPLLLMAVEGSQQILLEGKAAFDSPSVFILAAALLVFLACGLSLYGRVVRE